MKHQHQINFTMKKILAATLGLTAFVAFAFQTPAPEVVTPALEDNMEITWEGIEDGQEVVESSDFVAETN